MASSSRNRNKIFIRGGEIAIGGALLMVKKNQKTFFEKMQAQAMELMGIPKDGQVLMQKIAEQRYVLVAEYADSRTTFGNNRVSQSRYSFGKVIGR